MTNRDRAKAVIAYTFDTKHHRSGQDIEDSLTAQFDAACRGEDSEISWTRYAWNGKDVSLEEFIGHAVTYKNLTDLFIRNVYALSRKRLRACADDELEHWKACAEWCEGLLGKPSLLRSATNEETGSVSADALAEGGEG